MNNVIKFPLRKKTRKLRELEEFYSYWEEDGMPHEVTAAISALNYYLHLTMCDCERLRKRVARLEKRLGRRK